MVGTLGIYDAVERDCPRGDPRRFNKPDGSWLAKAGPKYPGAVSYWSEHGLRRYITSGLCAWHARVVDAPVEVTVIEKPERTLYEDEYQVIISPETACVIETIDLDHFLEREGYNTFS